MIFSSLFPAERDIDCITVGRANVDFYPDEGETLDSARSYNVYVGGSPANIAVGVSRHNLKSAIITRVAEDKHGYFVRDYLSSHFNVDVSQVQFDASGAGTSLAFAECRPDADVLMYRNQVADLFLRSDELDEAFIARAKCVCFSGTSLVSEISREAVKKVLDCAKKHGVVCVMDIDYRPYGWKSEEEAVHVISSVANVCDIIIGTGEEFEFSGAPEDRGDAESAEYFLGKGATLVVVKRAKDGSLCVYRDGGVTVSTNGFVFMVDVKKPYGAGDAFASSFISMLIKGNDVSMSMKYAAAAASINIAGVSCTEEMATEEEIKKFIENYREEK